MYNYMILKANKIEVRAGMRNPSPEIVKLCENAVYGRLRAPDCHLSLAWGKWMLECTQGACEKVVCVSCVRHDLQILSRHDG